MTALTEEDLDVVLILYKRKQCRIFLTHILLKGGCSAFLSSKEAPGSKENTTAKVQKKKLLLKRENRSENLL